MENENAVPDFLQNSSAKKIKIEDKNENSSKTMPIILAIIAWTALTCVITSLVTLYVAKPCKCEAPADNLEATDKCISIDQLKTPDEEGEGEVKNAEIKPSTSELVSTEIDKEYSTPWPSSIERTNDDPTTLTNKIKIPKINLTSQGAEAINQEIKDKYMKYLSDEQNYSKGPYQAIATYDYKIYDDILYVIIKFTLNALRATGSTSYDVYYYDIKSNARLTVEEMATRYNIRKDATAIFPSVADSFDYYYHDDNYCYRMGCEVMDNTF